MEQPIMYPCTVCGEEFSTPQQLQLHRRERHPQTEAPDAPQVQLQEQSQYEGGGEVF